MWDAIQSAVEHADDILLLGSPCQPFSDIVHQSLTGGGFPRRPLFRALVGQMRQVMQRLSNNKINAIHTLGLLPFNYNSLNCIGAGGDNTVFLGENMGNDAEAYALCISRKGFQSSADAMAYAIQQRNDYAYVLGHFGHINGLIPREHYLLFELKTLLSPSTRVICLREFVHGSIQDVFNIENTRLHDLLLQNSSLLNQLSSFVTVCNQNPTLVASQIDLLGECNLSVVTDLHTPPRLVMIDPHTRGTTAEFEPDKSVLIAHRIQYLSGLIDTINI